MFISTAALALFQAKNFAALHQLPIDQLIDAESLRQFKENKLFPTASQVATQTNDNNVPRIARDPVLLDELEDPVVTDGGHIFSRKVINQLPDPKLCPMTRTPITSIISLPQLTHAIAQWKLEKRAESLAINNYQFKINISKNKMRIIAEGPAQPIFDCFDYLFNGKDNNITRLHSNAYSAHAWSFAWVAVQDMSRLEMWFPTDQHHVTTQELVQLIESTIKPTVTEEVVEVTEDVPTITYDELSENTEQYVNVATMNLTASQLSDCIIAFIKAGYQLRQQREIDIRDTVEARDSARASRQMEGTFQVGVRRHTISTARTSAFHPPTLSLASPTLSFSQTQSQSSGSKRKMGT